MSVAVTLAMTVNALSTLGLGQYVASRPRHEPDAAFHATVIHVSLGLLALLGLYVLRTPLCALVHAPDGARYVPVLCVGFALERVAYVPERILLRDMRFREVSVARSSSGVLYTVASIALAALGLGGAAIAWGNAVRYATKLLLVVVYVERRSWLAPTRLDPRIARRLLAFGLPLSVSSFTGFVTANWDNLLIARWFGTGALGLYNLAYNLADTPATQIGEQAADVLVPSYAQESPDGRKRAFAKGLLALQMLIAPLAIGLGMVAPTLVDALLDARWRDAAPMLLVLSALSVVRPAAWVSSAYVQAIDRTRLAMAIEGTKTVALFGALALFGRLSPVWACAAIGVGFAVTSAVALLLVARADGMRLGELVATQLAPARPLLAMVVGVLLARRGLDALDAPAIVRLGGEIAVGAAAYVGGALAFVPAVAHELIDGARSALLRRSGLALEGGKG